MLYFNIVFKMKTNRSVICSFTFILGHDNSDSTVLDTPLSEMEIDCDKHEKQKKVKKSQKDPKINYRSDSNSPPPSRRRRSPSSNRRRGSPLSSRRHEKIVTYSPSPSPERYLEIKEESLELPQHLFGSYHCDVIYLPS